MPFERIRKFLGDVQRNREKRKRNPLVAGEVEGRPVHQSKIYSNLNEASREFGKKLGIGLNRVASREVWVHSIGGKVAVTPVVHAHGLRLGIQSLDVIERKRKIKSMPLLGERFGTRGGWWSYRLPAEHYDTVDAFMYSHHHIEKEGEFKGDRIQVYFIPPKTPWWVTDGNDAQWRRSLSAKHVIQVRVRVAPGENVTEKKEAYKKRFPFLWEKVGFEFVRD